jgi:transposase
MKTAATQSQRSADRPTLYLAFELGWQVWKLGFATDTTMAPRLRTLPARDTDRLEREIDAAKRHLGLPADAPVVSCYEAGRDGFWLHRFLEAAGMTSHVVDSSSIAVDRRARRAKTDRLDTIKLVRMLIRHHRGEPDIWSVVRVPTPEVEDLRQVHRELEALKRERTRLTNRIRGLLANQGVDLPLKKRSFLGQLHELRLWDGLPLMDQLRRRIERAWQRICWLDDQIRQVVRERRALLDHSTEPMLERVRQLSALRGIGEGGAWLAVTEFFGWREFRNRREIGALAGLVPTPYHSGDSERDQGVGKAGNRRIRTWAIEVAWGWLHYQPDAQVVRWYRRRFANQSKRIRKIGIVALARRILIELWMFLETGAVPDGAVTSS